MVKHSPKHKTQQKDTSPNKPRRARRRRPPTKSADSNVSFSKIKVSESNRVLRSGPKSDHSSSFRNSNDTPRRPEKDAVSRDNSNCKVSKRASQARARVSSTSSSSSDSLKLVIDLTSNEGSSCEQSSKEDAAIPVARQDYHDIKIIDFDDLELSNSCYRRHDSNRTNGHSVERPPLSVQQTPGKATNGEGASSNKKYLNLLENASFLEETQWMLASNTIQPAAFDNDETPSSPIYLNLDRHSSPVSSHRTSRHIASPVNFPSGGCFQRLGPAPTTSSIPEHFPGVCPYPRSMEEPRLPDQSEWSTKPHRNNIPNFQALLSALETPSTHHFDDKAIQCSFATSGGSIEKILSPVIPKQPEFERSFCGIPVPLQETNNAMPESCQFDEQSGQHAECRIHLVDTPPPFTRSPDLTPFHHRFQSRMMPQQEPTIFGVSDRKPRRTRRTRAQMQAHGSHRGKVNQRNSGNFPMEYHRGPYSHPHEFLSMNQFSSFHRGAMQQQGYSETYSMNEANVFAGSDSSQQYDAFPSFLHRMSEVSGFNPFSAALNSFSSPDNHQEFHTHPVGSAFNPSSVVWNQQVHVMEMQAAFGSVQPVPEADSRRLAAAWQSFSCPTTLWIPQTGGD